MSDLHWLLIDLDETLYPPQAGLWQAVAARINAFMEIHTRIPADQVPALRESYFREYGTTLNGLLAHHEIDPVEYMDFVHDIPVEKYLKNDSDLRDMLIRLPQRKAIFTNADRKHVERVTHALGLEGCFEQIVDLLTLELVNKPQPLAYEKTLNLLGGVDPSTCMLIDDQPRNLVPAKELGMHTVLVGNHAKHPGIDYRIPSIHHLPHLPILFESADPGSNGY